MQESLQRYAQAAPGEPKEIRIYDIAGRLERSLAIGRGDGGVVLWDGFNAGGSKSPAGIYFARLIGAGHEARTRIVLLP